MSGYFKRMSQLAQLSAAPANRSNQAHHTAHSQVTTAISESESISTVSHPATTKQQMDSPGADAFHFGVQEEPSQLTTYNRPNEFINEPNDSNEPKIDNGLFKKPPTVDSTISEKIATDPNTIVGNPKLTAHMDVELQPAPKVTSPPVQETNKITGLPSTETQSTRQPDIHHSQGKNGPTKLYQSAELSQLRSGHTTPDSSDINSAVDQPLPTSSQSQNSPIPRTAEKITSNTVAADETNSQKPATPTELIQYSEDKPSQLQQSQPRALSPAKPTQINSKVDVKIGSINIITDLENSQAPPAKPARAKRAQRTNGIWSSGRTLSRAYIRRS